MRKTAKFLLLFVLFFAFILRLRHLGWGFPDFLEDTLSVDFLRDFWGVYSGRFNFRPFRYDWSPFYYYLVFVVQYLYYLGGRLSGHFADLTALRLEWVFAPANLYYLGRLVSVAFATATLGVMYRLGRLLFNTGVVLLGVLFFSLDPIFLRYSQTMQSDVPQLFFFLLAGYFIILIQREGQSKNYLYAGIAIGLGAATKYTPIILMVPALLAHYQRAKKHDEALISGKAVGLILLPFIVFACAVPYALLDPANFLNWVSYQIYHLRSGHFTNRSRWLFPGIGPQHWQLNALILLSALYFTAKRKKSSLLFLFIPLLYYLFIIKNATVFDYYLLPIYPFFYLLLANGISALAAVTASRVTSQGRKTFQAAMMLVFSGCLLFPLLKADIQYLRAKEQKNTYTLAREWIEKNIAGRTLLISEIPPPPVREYRVVSYIVRSPAFEKSLPELLRRLARKPIYHIQMMKINTSSPGDNAELYELDNYRLFPYFIVNYNVAARYLKEPAQYPVQNRFYQELANEFQQAARFVPGNELEPEIIIYKNPHPDLTTSTPLASVRTFKKVQKEYRQKLDTIRSYLAARNISAQAL